MSRQSMSPETAAIMVRIGDRLKSARLAKGMALRDAAPLVGVSAMALSNWERGKVGLTSAHLCKAGAAYDVKPAWLLAAAVLPEVTLGEIHWHRLPRGLPR